MNRFWWIKYFFEPFFFHSIQLNNHFIYTWLRHSLQNSHWKFKSQSRYEMVLDLTYCLSSEWLMSSHLKLSIKDWNLHHLLTRTTNYCLSTKLKMYSILLPHILTTVPFSSHQILPFSSVPSYEKALHQKLLDTNDILFQQIVIARALRRYLSSSFLSTTAFVTKSIRDH